VDLDEQGYPVRLPLGLGNLPLHPEQDGWYSLLGSWGGARDNPNPDNQASEANQENDYAIPPPAMNPPRNDRPSPPNIFCQYHKCSGNRLAIPFYSALYAYQLYHTNMYSVTPSVALILVPQADLPARPQIALGQEHSRLSRPLADTT